MAFPFFTPKRKPVSIPSNPAGTPPELIEFAIRPESQQILIETNGAYLDLMDYLVWRLKVLDDRIKVLEAA